MNIDERIGMTGGLLAGGEASGVDESSDSGMVVAVKTRVNRSRIIEGIPSCETFCKTEGNLVESGVGVSVSGCADAVDTVFAGAIAVVVPDGSGFDGAG